MRIISCHIENFGKIHDFTYDFRPGLNVICEENGWGKSTFAGFIKAMFYGLEGERKRSLAENERKKYRPWQGGIFGGHLVFETRGKTYRITRVFGEKEASDEFELRDEKTNLVSNDFSSKIGEELFHIDKASFVRTVFIEQNGCSTGMTDSINAKIGNLTDNTDDINNYETATKNITDMLNKMSATRSTGSISRRKSEINDLQVKINEGNGIGEAIDRCRQLAAKDEEEQTHVKSEISNCQNIQKKVSSLQAVLAKKREWEKLTEKEKEADRRQKAARIKFPGDVPKRDDIDVAIKSCAYMEQRKRSISNLMLTDDEKETIREGKICFGETVPSERELSDIIALASSYKEKKNLAEKEMISEAARLAMQSALESKKGEEKKISPLLIIGILILAAGIVSFIFLPAMISIAIAVVGSALVLLGILKKKSSADKKAEFSEMESLRNKFDYENLRANAEGVEETTKPAAYEEDRVKIRRFLDEFGIDAGEDSCIDELYSLKAKRGEYVRLLEQQKNCNEETEAYDNYANALYGFYKKYKYVPDEDMSSQLSDIRDNIIEYANAVSIYEGSKNELKEFEESNSMKDIISACEDESLPTLDEINETLQKLNERQEELHKQIVSYNQELESLQEKFDTWEDNKIRLEGLKEEQKEEQAKLKALTAVKGFLTSAKEALTLKYAAPILESFKKYYAIIDNSKQDRFNIDANTNITVNECGMQRELDTQSTGYQDLCALCLRAALIDAMYKNESPTVIMDDPFTNLDDVKAEKAKVFLEKFSEDYQTIYFTCSNARA